VQPVLHAFRPKLYLEEILKLIYKNEVQIFFWKNTKNGIRKSHFYSTFLNVRHTEDGLQRKLLILSRRVFHLVVLIFLSF
jgi:hypothetical protein